MNILKLFLCMFLCALCLSCRKHDYHTVVIHVPEMHNKACAELVSKAVYVEVNRCRALHGEKSMSLDLRKRTVTVTYDSLNMALKNIEFAIAKVGFATDEVPADLSAVKKLPAECKSPVEASHQPEGLISNKPLGETAEPSGKSGK
ncbi:MAG: heavy-metal-associated domain-containing protein [Kiritimatiellae bacterium]|nr:heavy-metal-associated domain-containing protein [Kiritimatiellia bacterium]